MIVNVNIPKELQKLVDSAPIGLNLSLTRLLKAISRADSGVKAGRIDKKPMMAILNSSKLS